MTWSHFCFIKKYTKYNLSLEKDKHLLQHVHCILAFCFKIDNMPLKETTQSVLINRGENLILNCTCYNECNGQWSGPNTIALLNAGDFIPYTQGLDLNRRLHKSKYSIDSIFTNAIYRLGTSCQMTMVYTCVNLCTHQPLI